MSYFSYVFLLFPPAAAAPAPSPAIASVQNGIFKRQSPKILAAAAAAAGLGQKLPNVTFETCRK